MKLYNFQRLIRKYSVTFSLCQETEGEYVGGKWEDGTKTYTDMQGAIVPISERKMYDSGGTFTAQDRELYVMTPLKGPLSALRVIYKGNVYSVETGRNFEDYADAAVYSLKWQSKVVDNA